MVYTECVYHCAWHSVSGSFFPSFPFDKWENWDLAKWSNLKYHVQWWAKWTWIQVSTFSICAASWLIHKRSLSQLYLLMNSPRVGDTFSLWIYLHDEGGQIQENIKIVVKNKFKDSCFIFLVLAQSHGRGSRRFPSWGIHCIPYCACFKDLVITTSWNWRDMCYREELTPCWICF